MRSLLGNIRFYVLSFSILLSVAIYIQTVRTIPEGSLQIIRLTEYYALIAITYLYLALLATPLTRTFTFLPFRGKYIKARRAIGVSAFYFGLLHACFAFFGELGGFPGLFYLPGKYLLGISLSFTALVILATMASTSFDFMIDKLGFQKWKFLHRFVYLAAVLILIHALMLGTHFQDLSTLIPQILFAAIAILLLLEAKRFDNYLQTKFLNLPKFGFSMLVVIILVAGYLILSFSSGGAVLPSLNIHAAHIQLAKRAQEGGSGLNYSSSVANNPGLIGDRTRRFTVSFIHPDIISPNQDTNLSFQVFDASSGNQVRLFQFVYSKVMHLIIVDSELKYFNHIHPNQTDQTFNITTQFPNPGQYHLYLDFQPLGAIEQQFAFTLNVGAVSSPTTSSGQPDTNLTKTFGEYQVTLGYPVPLKAEDLSIGKQKLTFNIKDSNGNPVTNLKPYLAAFGHLVMINTTTFDYIHVHPSNLVAPAPDANGGPIVEFLPLGLYGPIKPGVYRIFGQFNPDNKLFVADFTIKVE